MAYRFGVTHTVGLRELRQRASDIVRDVEDGREVEVTVNGRVAARLVPAHARRFRDPEALARAFATGTRPDPEAWARDIAAAADDRLRDPWAGVAEGPPAGGGRGDGPSVTGPV